MAGTSATAVIDRLIHDDDLHKQLAVGGERLRDAYHSLSEAAHRAVGRPEPEPPKHRGRRFAMLAIAVGLVLLVRDMHRRQQSQA